MLFAVISEVVATQPAGISQILWDDVSTLPESVDAGSIRNTALILAGHRSQVAELDTAGLPFALVPPNVDIPTESEMSVKQLARTANIAAASVLCGSILAGHTSDADDFGDVAIYLGPGDYGSGHKQDALQLLWLEDVMSSDNSSNASPKACTKYYLHFILGRHLKRGRIADRGPSFILTRLLTDHGLQATHRIEPSSAHLIPRTVNVSLGDASEDAIKELDSLLIQLEDRYAFCVSGPGVFVFYFLLGRDRGSRWMGLGGVGVHS